MTLKQPSKFSSDEEVLQTHFPLRARPLARFKTSPRILFSHGCQLGLGDQFMCMASLEEVMKTMKGASVSILTDYPEFWDVENRSRFKVLRRAKDDTTSVVGMLSEGYDLALVGYHPGSLASFVDSPIPIIFCAGRDLAQFRCFFAHLGTVEEVPLFRCKSSLVEADKFTALFDDIGLIDFNLPKGRIFEGYQRYSLLTNRTTESRVRVLIHPWSSEEDKEWSLDDWTVVAKKLALNGIQVAFSSGSTFREYQISRTLPRDIDRVSVLEPISLSEFLQTLRSFDLVLSGDTFVPHAAAYFREPLSLAVYGPTDYLRYCPPAPCAFPLPVFDVTPSEVACAAGFVLGRQGDIVDENIPQQALRDIESVFLLLRDLAWRLIEEDGAGATRFAVAKCLKQCIVSAPKNLRKLMLGREEDVQKVISTLETESARVAVDFLEQISPIRMAALIADRFREVQV